MIIKLRWIVISESVVILILIAALINSYVHRTEIKNQIPADGLLSPRVYSGLIEPKSLLITNFAPLKEKLQAYISKNNLNVLVYIENYRNGVWTGINEKTGFFPASLNKLPVAVLIMRKVENGELSMDTMLKIEDSDRTDSSGELYKIKEKELPLRVVLEKLLKESDNTALRILLHYVNAEDLQFVLDYYGIDINVDYQKQQKARNPDLTTPKSISNLFSSLYFSTVLEPHDSEYILSLLSDTVFDIKKIAKLPDDVKVVQKYGENYYENNRFFHDCGIIYINDSRIFYCIMTKGIGEEEAVETIGVVVNTVYRYVVDAKAKLSANKQKDYSQPTK